MNNLTYPTFECDTYEFNSQKDFDLVYDKFPEILGFIDT